MKKVMILRASIIVAIVLAFTAGINAQMRMKPEERLKHYQERLKLDDKQTKAVDAILKKTDEKRQSIRNSGSRPQREDMIKIMDEETKQIEKVLKPSQKAEFKKMVDERKQRMEERRFGRNQ